MRWVKGSFPSGFASGHPGLLLACGRLCKCSLALPTRMVVQVLKPVNPRAQSRVPAPEDVDLDAVIDGAALERVLAIEVSRGRLFGLVTGQAGSGGWMCGVL